MHIYRVNQNTAAKSSGVVIVIDVIRAFTVAGYAFAGGARNLWLVRSIEEARALRARRPDALLGGEVGGRLIEGFDFNNSPSRMATADVHGQLLIQRTGAGTQGAVKAVNASHILLCALTNARATATYARMLAESTAGPVTLFPTASLEEGERQNEDDICADYLEALLLNPEEAPGVLIQGMDYLHGIERFKWFEQDDSDVPFADVACILATDQFHFAMVGTHKLWNSVNYVDVQKIDVPTPDL